MTLTLAQMETGLQRYGFDTTDPLSTWINAAMHDLETAADWLFLEEGETSIVVNPGANVLTLPTDFSRIIIVRDNTNFTKLTYWDRKKFAHMVQDPTDSGLPELFTIIGMNQIQLWRVPYMTINFGIVYEALTADLVNPTDVPTANGQPWPSAFSYPIIVHAAEIALMAENEEDRAQTAQKTYEAMLLRLMGKYTNRQIGETDAVQDTQGYGSDMPIQGSIGGW